MFLTVTSSRRRRLGSLDQAMPGARMQSQLPQFGKSAPAVRIQSECVGVKYCDSHAFESKASAPNNQAFSFSPHSGSVRAATAA